MAQAAQQAPAGARGPRMKILFASDFHGNEQHIAALAAVAAEVRPDAVVYLGDISPNRFMYENPAQADEYNLRVFFPAICALEAPRKYVIPGNTDFNLSKIKYERMFDDPARCKFMQQGFLQVLPGVNMLFYHFTRFSPHSMKDGEKFDVSRLPEHHREVVRRIVTEDARQPDCAGGGDCDLLRSHRDIERRARERYALQDNICLRGVVSGAYAARAGSFTATDCLLYENRFYQRVDVFDRRTQPVWFRRQLSTTIYEDILRMNRDFDARRRGGGALTIWATHSPAYNTNGDVIRSGEHVGSRGIRAALCRYQPDLVVSGHIHESCRDGRFESCETICGRRVRFASLGNEALVMPYCLRAHFLVVAIEGGAIASTERIARDVPVYRDARDALARFAVVRERLRLRKEDEC